MMIYDATVPNFPNIDRTIAGEQPRKPPIQLFATALNTQSHYTINQKDNELYRWLSENSPQSKLRQAGTPA